MSESELCPWGKRGKIHLTPLVLCPKWVHKTYCTSLSESIIRIYPQCQTHGIRAQSISHLRFSPQDAEHLESWKLPNEWVIFFILLFFRIFLATNEHSQMWALLTVLPSDIRFTNSLKDQTFNIQRRPSVNNNLLWFTLMMSLYWIMIKIRVV